MVIAALVAFAILLVAWIAAPDRPARPAEREPVRDGAVEQFAA